MRSKAMKLTFADRELPALLLIIASIGDTSERERERERSVAYRWCLEVAPKLPQVT